ncbi:hypothetical protein [Flavobacterium croceum]|uniref:hypothetical protein n=1 Tax=Flavobacterium croceum TaxID=370975 RepID=UPI0024A81DF0|nr:hypothetical protein [Flavobacterium croceum]
MKIKVLIGLFTLVMVFSCKDKTAENNDGKNNVATETPKPTNVIQLANYSDVNWKNGVGITFKMLLVDFSQEKFDLISKGTQIQLGDGKTIPYVGCEKSGNFIQILLPEVPTKYQAVAEYPNELAIK